MRVRRRRRQLAGALAVAVVGLVGLAVSPSASASSTHAAAKTAVTAGKTLPAGERQVCPTPTSPGVMSCLSVIKTGTRAAFQPDLVNPFAYRPADLQQAYNLVAASKNRGKGMTVAIVDGGDDPDAARNLAAYRKEWGLPACDTATGAGCLVKVNQNGKASPLPIADPTGSWEVEESLDLDMVSAICPNCRILLVEAGFDAANIPEQYNPGITQFSAAEDSAVALGAKFVSNSWGGPECVPAPWGRHHRRGGRCGLRRLLPGEHPVRDVRRRHHPGPGNGQIPGLDRERLERNRVRLLGRPAQARVAGRRRHLTRRLPDQDRQRRVGGRRP
jgi:hypothetical protein